MGPNASNRAIEDAAVSWVIQVERDAGRQAVDARGKGQAGDVVSPPRTIKIKAHGTTARGSELWLEVRQVEAARSDPEFYVYVVENVRQGDPGQFRLVMLGGARVQRLLSRAQERRTSPSRGPWLTTTPNPRPTRP